MKPESEHSLVVGGTRGAGRAVVQLFSQAGHTVSALGSRPPYEPDAAMPGVHYWVVDLQDKKLVEDTIAKILANHGLINRIVFLQRYRGQGDKWQGEFSTSLTATKNIIELTADHFADSENRSIVMVSSMAARFIAEEQPLSYHVSKAALNQMVRFYALTLAKKRIRVNSISCATILKKESQQFYQENKELLELYQKITPLNRLCTPEDLAGLIDFLTCAKSAFLTGQDILLDGGLSLQGHESLARKLTHLDGVKITRD